MQTVWIILSVLALLVGAGTGSAAAQRETLTVTARVIDPREREVPALHLSVAPRYERWVEVAALSDARAGGSSLVRVVVASPDTTASPVPDRVFVGPAAGGRRPARETWLPSGAAGAVPRSERGARYCVFVGARGSRVPRAVTVTYV